jgi:predicted GIY-YIG superfamily endonuclease
MFWVYVLQNSAGRFYTGQTDDLDRRLSEHNYPEAGSGKYTHKNGPWHLVYSEIFENRSEAVQRERFIKARKSTKWIKANLLLTNRASPDGHRD